MAEVVQEMPRKKGGGGRTPIYPYADWLNGEIWKLKQGEDFEAQTSSMLTNLRVAAKGRKLKVTTRIETNRDSAGDVVSEFIFVKAQPLETPVTETPAPTPVAETPVAPANGNRGQRRNRSTSK